MAVTGPSSLRAVILGGVAWNTMVYRDELPSGDPGTIFVDRAHDTVGSSGAGKAMNLSTLGVDTVLWGLVGDDGYAGWIREVLDPYGIDFLSQTSEAGTERHVNFMDAVGDRLSVFVNPGPDDSDIDTSVVEPLLSEADIVSVVIKNYCRAFLPLVKRSGVDLWVDIHDYDGVNPYHTEFIEAADCLTMSSRLHKTWRGFLESRIEAGARVCIATHGAEGASAITAEDGWVDVPAVPVDRTVDTNGAGDAFFAGFSTTWVTTGNLASSLDAGAHQAALAVQSPELAPMPGGSTQPAMRRTENHSG